MITKPAISVQCQILVNFIRITKAGYMSMQFQTLISINYYNKACYVSDMSDSGKLHHDNKDRLYVNAMSDFGY